MEGHTAPLSRRLTQRQLNMIAIGGVIGAGLFVGSGVAIQVIGPGAFLTYALAGVLIIIVMRMLGEMATANPSTGSFADYARKALGGWAGFSVGWMYWYFWVIVVGFEAVAGGKVITYWFHAPLWLLALILMVLMTATNLFSVESFGEFEFWFASIKITAIVLFLGLGTLYVIGVWPGHHTDFTNLTSHGGFFPNGVGAMLAAIVVVIFSMTGAEIATIAAAETPDPKRAIARATNSVVARIAIFFVGSVFLLVVILPWDSLERGASPYVAALRQIGIPGADHIMNAVVLTAVLSCLNSGLYTASRMLFVLAGQREAPAALLSVNARGVPYIAIACSSLVGFLCVLMARFAPDSVFTFLLSSSGAVILVVYLLIALSQIVLRYRTPADKLRVKVWGFPVLSVFTVAGIAGVLLRMAFDRTTRTELWLSLLSWAVVIALYFALLRWRSVASDAGQSPTEKARRVLVLVNEDLSAAELLDVLQDVDADEHAEYLLCVPADAADGARAQTEGAVPASSATADSSRRRLADMLSALRRKGLRTQGRLGDHRPVRALANAVESFGPDRLVIAEPRSAEAGPDLVDHARAAYPIPVTCVASAAPD